MPFILKERKRKENAKIWCAIEQLRKPAKSNTRIKNKKKAKIRDNKIKTDELIKSENSPKICEISPKHLLTYLLT